MYRCLSRPQAILAHLVATCLFWVAGTTMAAETELLEITVEKPTLLSTRVNQNTASLAISRTGVVAVFYPKHGTGPKFYRTSSDSGRTWRPEMASPPALAGGSATARLRHGGVLKFLTTDSSFPGEAEFRTSPMEGKFIDGWFTLHSTFAWFNDDFTEYEVAPVQVYMPDAVTKKQPQLIIASWPIFADDKMIVLPNGDLLATMQGVFKGDTMGRVIICSSTDEGRKWRYYSTVAYEPRDPTPDLPGQYLGFAEPSFELLPNGQMICAMRTQYSHLPGEYRPIYLSWSDDMGKTWTKPVATNPHLMNICPELAVLENGVLACQYGRPGFHIAFSLDNGHTWQDRISLSDLPCGVITGQFDMVRVGPNRLLAVGNDDEGTKVWPISVDRVTTAVTERSLRGRVVDAKGEPIAHATIERSPNRYTADDWFEHATEKDQWYKRFPTTEGSPRLGFRSIRQEDGYPTVKTDQDGRYEFARVPLAEYILTVEADGYAPQQRHVKHRPRSEPQDFRLKPGRLVRSRVVDQGGEGIPGLCVVLNRWHTHTDSGGYFHWSVENPPPEQVDLKVYKRYSGEYESLEANVAYVDLARQAIIFKKRK